MTFQMSRRHLLTSTAAGAIGGAVRPSRVLAEGLGPTAMKLVAVRRVIEVNGKAASVFGLLRSDGTPGLFLDPGQRFNVEVDNQCAEPTIIHWHGQTPPPDQDGVVETRFASLIAPGSRQSYDFAPRIGTHWMHSHHGLQEQYLMAAPLIVRDAEDMRSDAQDVVVLLHDFSFLSPGELLSKVTGSSEPAGTATPAMLMPGAGTPDLNDIGYDAYLANDRTLDDPLMVRTQAGARVRLRLINGATSTAFWIDLGELDGTVVAADGNDVWPISAKRFPMAEGQRLDVLVQLPSGGGSYPVLAQREGDRQRTGIILATSAGTVAKVSPLADALAPPIGLSLEQRLSALRPLTPRAPGVTHRIALTGAMRPYVWSLDDRTWADHQPLLVQAGQRVVLEMVNRTAMAHPMHLHGHHFQVVALNGQALPGAFRDTILVPAKGTVTVAFDADNPGRWLLHCHNLFHMATGMMTEIAYDPVA